MTGKRKKNLKWRLKKEGRNFLKNRVLVDTSIWIQFFRAEPKISDSMKALLMENAVWTCGMVMFEVLQGIKSEHEKTKILDILSALPYMEMNRSLWQKSAELSASLKKNGLNLPLSDIFIAAICLENNLPIFTLDDHFEKIPEVKIYKI
jgi:tRNA(fMet)-specific endonuclease VapC